MQAALQSMFILPRALQPGRTQPRIQVSGRLCLPGFPQERVALFSLRQFPGCLSRFVSHSL